VGSSSLEQWGVHQGSLHPGYNDSRKLQRQFLFPGKLKWKAEGNMGCHGGLMDQGFTYIIKNGGIDTEDSYKYTAKDGTCAFNKDNVGATISKCYDVPQQSEADLESAVASVGPISVAIDAHLRSFQLYKHGIYHDKHCSSTRLDHGVLAVGYNNDDNGKYWIVKNSWGPGWGDQGYINILRHDTATEDDSFCGIDKKPKDGIACKDPVTGKYPEQSRVCGMCGLLFDSVAPKYGKLTAAKHSQSSLRGKKP